MIFPSAAALKKITGIVAVAVLAIAGSASAAPDMILHNGKIITVDDQFSIQQAVAIDGNRIAAVGDNAAIAAMADDDTKLIDLAGRTVIPGLIDNHNHVIRATEYWANEARLDGVTSRAEILERIAAKAATLPAGEWVFTLGGWYEDQLIGDRSPITLDELDRAAPDNPAFIQSKYSHAFVNTAWLQEMGYPVTADEEYIADADGLAADVQRDEDGRATGTLEGGFWMVGRAIERFPAVSEEDQIEGINALMADLNAMGVTAVYDPAGLGIKDESYARIGALADQGKLTVRIYYTLWGGPHIDTAEEVDAFISEIETNTPFQGDEWFDLIAMGEVYYQPFHFDNLTRTVNPGPAEFATAERILTASARGGWPVQTHAVQPETISGFLDVVERVNAKHPVKPLRWTITHSDNIQMPQIQRARALGITLQLRSQALIGELGPAFEKHGDAVHYMPALRRVEDSGIIWGLGTDGTKAAQINPFNSLWWAVTGKMFNGDVITKEHLTREEALIAHTRSNAYIVFQEANMGAIRPGFLADMVVLDRDYLTVPVDEIRQIRPAATIVGGDIVYGGF